MVSWIALATILQASTLQVDRVEFESYGLEPASTRLTLSWRAGDQVSHAKARIYGVEAFNQVEQETIGQAKRERAPRTIGCGLIDPYLTWQLGLLLPNHRLPQITLLLLGKDPDGTLVVDWKLQNGVRTSYWLLSQGICKIDSRIQASDQEAAKAASDAKEQRIGSWRWLPQIPVRPSPPTLQSSSYKRSA